MSFTINYSRQLPFSQDILNSPNNSSFFKRSREVSTKFNELEDKILNLQLECSSFRKSLDSGRQLIEDERKKISKSYNRHHVRTPQHPPPQSRSDDIIGLKESKRRIQLFDKTPKNAKKNESEIILYNNSFYRENSECVDFNNRSSFDLYDDESSFELFEPEKTTFSNSIESYRQNEINLNQKVNEMREKILEIEERVTNAQNILSIPIVDIDEERNLAEEAEKKLNEIRKSLNFSNNDYDDFYDDINDIELIEKKNAKRSKELNLKKLKIDEIKNSMYNSKSSFKKYDRKSSAFYSNLKENRHSLNLANELALKKIDEHHNKLKARSLSIQEEEESIDRYENELLLKRKQMEQEWKLKMKKIENLSSMKQTIDRLNFNINSEKDEIEQLNAFYNNLETQKISISKRISNYMSDSRNEKIFKLNQKRRKIESDERKLREKRRKIDRLEESVRRSIIQMKLYSDQVNHLETQVEKMSQTTEEQLIDLQKETTRLSKSLAMIKSLSNDKNIKNPENTEEFIDFDNYE